MDTNKLRPATKALWEQLQNDPLLNGFVLFGGTALTLRIGHRVSEDLDFAYASSIRLPEKQLKAFIAKAGKNKFKLDQNPLDVEEFLNDGLDLIHYQQNYIVDGVVKVTFVAPEPDTAKLIKSDPFENMRVATLDEIFGTKALVCADRSKTRDWFDIYILMTQHGYTMRDFYRVFEMTDRLPKFQIAGSRLRTAKPQAGDEGYEHLLSNAPTLDQMRAYFVQQLDSLEQRLAAEAFAKKLSSPSL